MNTHQMVTIVVLHLGWKHLTFFFPFMINTSVTMSKKWGKKKRLSSQSLEVEHNYATTSVTYGFFYYFSCEWWTTQRLIWQNKPSIMPQEDSSMEQASKKAIMHIRVNRGWKKKKRKKTWNDLSIHLLIILFWKMEEKCFAICPEASGASEQFWKQTTSLQKVVTEQWHLVAKK